MFIGDSRVRELFHEFIEAIIGTPHTYVRTHGAQFVLVDRLRLRAVSILLSAFTHTVGIYLMYVCMR